MRVEAYYVILTVVGSSRYVSVSDTNTICNVKFGYPICTISTELLRCWHAVCGFVELVYIRLKILCYFGQLT